MRIHQKNVVNEKIIANLINAIITTIFDRLKQAEMPYVLTS
jgi:hypothetical protein